VAFTSLAHIKQLQLNKGIIVFKFLKCIIGMAMLCGVGTAAQAQSYDYFLLAASWQPGFCVSHTDKPECANLRGTYAADSLVLHGLWPNNYDGNHPQYCNAPQRDIDLDLSGAWCSMDPYGVSGSVLSTLSTTMPGVMSCLDKHEWFKHGDCAGATPDAYWQTADSLVSRLGQTALNSFLRAHAGNTVSRTQLIAAFESSFGRYSRSAVAFKCTKTNNVSYLTEVWINLNPAALDQFPANSSLITCRHAAFRMR